MVSDSVVFIGLIIVKLYRTAWCC